MKPPFVGCGVAIATPFADGKVDYLALENHINFLIHNKADCIIPCGTTGESATLTKEEKIEITRFVLEKVDKRVPVIPGTGGNNTEEVKALSKEMEALGVDALMIVTPYYNKATQKGLVKHFSEVAGTVELPIILYNVPGRTGVNIKPQTLVELKKMKNIVGLKEASGDISQIGEIAHLCPELSLYSGNDDQIFPILAYGGVGAISVIANIAPKQVHEMIKFFLNNEITNSKQMQLKMLELIKALFCEVSPVPVKAALSIMGMCQSYCRPPLYEMESENLEYLKKEMRSYGLFN